MLLSGGEAVPKKVREILKMLQEDGWFEVKQAGSHKQFKHPNKQGKVTVPAGGSLNDDLDPKTERSILKQAGL
jgi:predicted RNA binding protein YcfA (HicA-like mRNA interferase family)